MKDRKLFTLGTPIVLGAVIACAVAAALTAGTRVNCRSSLESPTGAYAHLAVVDDEGYVLPFSRLNLDDGAVWELEIKAEEGEVRRVRDRSLIKTPRSPPPANALRR